MQDRHPSKAHETVARISTALSHFSNQKNMMTHAVRELKNIMSSSLVVAD